MKQYLLLLRSSDFNKNENIWTTNPINVYSNSQYKNYSYTRSPYGINLIGDRTYVGTELTSPSVMGENSTPYSSNSVYKTDVGEIIYEPATPDLLRFIDTTSRVDLLGYRHIFTNITGTFIPTFTITVYESDEENGPWLKSFVSEDINILLIKKCKPFIKIELDISAEEIDLNSVGLVFYLEVGIHDPISPIISKSVKNIARRFPSWTAFFEDSLDDATPELATPDSVAGKFMTAILQESLDKFSTEIDVHDINSFINSADINMLAWVYVAYDVPQNINLISGDNIPLSRVSSMINLLNGRSTDYSYYYNPLDKILYSLKEYDELNINNTFYEQTPVNIFNDFDEFGARVGLPRLYLESNLNYKKRILDVTQNLPGVSKEAFKRTLRRELDIWRVYGATPDSNYSGATPEILEISDIETSTPFFSIDGKPEIAFRNLVEELNVLYPTNVGYVRWDEGLWDSAGLSGEGASRIPAIYDVHSTPYAEYYQPGVGDFDDALVVWEPLSSATVDFTGSAKITGFKEYSRTDIYPTIFLDYLWFFGYSRFVSDVERNTVPVGVVYEISLPPHDNYSTPSVFYANINYQTYDELNVTNHYLDSYPASPEYIYFNVFDSEGLTEIEFKNKIDNSVYYNSTSTPASTKISAYDAASVNIIFSSIWDVETQSYDYLSTPYYKGGFNSSTINFEYEPSNGSSISIASPNITPDEADLIFGSNLYFGKEIFEYTTPVSSASKILINSTNILNNTATTPAYLYTSDIIRYMALPTDATPEYIYIEASTPDNLSIYGEEFITSVYGGYSIHPYDDQTYIIPSSPNILYKTYDSAGAEIDGPYYFEQSTINYNSTPDYLKIYSFDENNPSNNLDANSNGYPFQKINYVYYESESTPSLFSGFIDQNGNAYKTSNEYENTFAFIDNYLETIELNNSTFGVDSSKIHIIDNIILSATPNTVSAYLLNKYDDINNINTMIEDSSSLKLSINARKDVKKQNQYSIGINPGFIHINEKDKYIYRNPVEDQYNGQFFNINLNSIPRAAAPIIVSVDDTEIRNVAFEDQATPGKLVFENTEIVYGNSSNSLFLAYENLTNIRVVDTYTGKTLFTDISTLTNEITPFDLSTPSVLGREYEVSYYVPNSYFIDKDVYNESSDSYDSVIYFSSTPNTPVDYSIIYETALNEKFIDTELVTNQNTMPHNEGFIYVSDETFDFGTIKAYLSPSAIPDSGGNAMFLSIISYDVNGNYKPYQTFVVSSQYLTAIGESDIATPNIDGSMNVITNEYGFVSLGLKYTGPTPAVSDSDIISITCIEQTTPSFNYLDNPGGFAYTVEYEILKTKEFKLEVKATPIKLNINTDEFTDVNIVGQVYWRGIPLNQAVNIGYNISRTLYDLFDSSLTNFVTTDNSGKFLVSKTITSQDLQNPGIWFARIEIIDTVEYLEALLGESNITITGDIVYWNEKYDNLNFENEDPTFAFGFVSEKQENSSLIATPNFVYQHYNSLNITNLDQSPNWEPPQWVRLNKFDQYQMGIFGTTPNYIVDIDLIHPDFGEE